MLAWNQLGLTYQSMPPWGIKKNNKKNSPKNKKKAQRLWFPATTGATEKTKHRNNWRRLISLAARDNINMHNVKDLMRTNSVEAPESREIVSEALSITLLTLFPVFLVLFLNAAAKIKPGASRASSPQKFSFTSASRPPPCKQKNRLITTMWTMFFFFFSKSWSSLIQSLKKNNNTMTNSNISARRRWCAWKVPLFEQLLRFKDCERLAAASTSSQEIQSVTLIEFWGAVREGHYFSLRLGVDVAAQLGLMTLKRWKKKG